MRKHSLWKNFFLSLRFVSSAFFLFAWKKKRKEKPLTSVCNPVKYICVSNGNNVENEFIWRINFYKGRNMKVCGVQYRWAHNQRMRLEYFMLKKASHTCEYGCWAFLDRKLYVARMEMSGKSDTTIDGIDHCRFSYFCRHYEWTWFIRIPDEKHFFQKHLHENVENTHTRVCLCVRSTSSTWSYLNRWQFV